HATNPQVVKHLVLRRAPPRLERCACDCLSPWRTTESALNGAEMRRGRCKPRFRAPGRNVGNVGRFPGALGRPPDAPESATLSCNPGLGDIIAQSCRSAASNAMRAEARLTGAARRWQATPTRPTILNLGIVTACVMAITDFAFLMLNTVGAPRLPFRRFLNSIWRQDCEMRRLSAWN